MTLEGMWKKAKENIKPQREVPLEETPQSTEAKNEYAQIEEFAKPEGKFESVIKALDGQINDGKIPREQLGRARELRDFSSGKLFELRGFIRDDKTQKHLAEDAVPVPLIQHASTPGLRDSWREAQSLSNEIQALLKKIKKQF